MLRDHQFSCRFMLPLCVPFQSFQFLGIFIRFSYFPSLQFIEQSKIKLPSLKRAFVSRTYTKNIRFLVKALCVKSACSVNTKCCFTIGKLSHASSFRKHIFSLVFFQNCLLKDREICRKTSKSKCKHTKTCFQLLLNFNFFLVGFCFSKQEKSTGKSSEDLAARYLRSENSKREKKGVSLKACINFRIYFSF